MLCCWWLRSDSLLRESPIREYRPVGLAEEQGIPLNPPPSDVRLVKSKEQPKVLGSLPGDFGFPLQSRAAELS